MSLLLTKSKKYFYDAAAIADRSPTTAGAWRRRAQRGIVRTKYPDREARGLTGASEATYDRSPLMPRPCGTGGTCGLSIPVFPTRQHSRVPAKTCRNLYQGRAAPKGGVVLDPFFSGSGTQRKSSRKAGSQALYRHSDKHAKVLRPYKGARG